MNAGAKAALLHAKAGAQTEYVIEWNDKLVKSIKTGFNKACQTAGLEGVTPHILRHTAAVHMVQVDKPIIEVAQYLGILTRRSLMLSILDSLQTICKNSKHLRLHQIKAGSMKHLENMKW